MMKMQGLYLCFTSALLWVGPTSPVTARLSVDLKESSAQTMCLKKSCLSWLEICDVRQIDVRLWEKDMFYSNFLKSYPSTTVV